MQSINATVVDGYTIDIKCHFIHGSDALGCNVVLVSDRPGVNYETMNISMNNNVSAQRISSPTGLLAIAECLHLILKLMALSVTLPLRGNIQPKSNSSCAGMHSLNYEVIIIAL